MKYKYDFVETYIIFLSFSHIVISFCEENTLKLEPGFIIKYMILDDQI